MLTRNRVVVGAVLGIAALLPVASCQPASAPVGAVSAPSPPPTVKQGPLAEAEFEALLDKCLAEVSAKNAKQATRWGLGKYAYWDMDQDVGELTFEDPVRGEAVLPVQIVATWSEDDGNWLWAWDNPSVDDELKRDAERVRQFGEENQLALLTRARSTVTEAEAWRLTALAAHLAKAQGVYCGTFGPVTVFVTFGEVRRTPARPTLRRN